MVIVIILLFLVCCYLTIYTVQVKRHIRKVSSIIQDISLGNFNRRFYTHIHSKDLQQLNSSLNLLMNQHETVVNRMQKVEKLQKRMISDISHDLRTPLTSLMGYVEALQKDQSLNEEERNNCLDIVARKSKYLLALIEDFFELSKLEADDTLLECGRIDLSEKLKEILAGLYQDFIREGITPEIQLPEEPMYVLGNSKAIDRILLNLLSNALRHGSDGGRIGIALREDGEDACVDIWDYGKGIAEKDRKYVFDRLYTAERSRNQRGSGSGLGLTIARKLVEKQQGSISLHSVPGEKTVFTFMLKRVIE